MRASSLTLLKSTPPQTAARATPTSWATKPLTLSSARSRSSSFRTALPQFTTPLTRQPIPFPRSTICLIGCLPAATALILHLTPSSPPATAESTSPITSCRSLTTSPECFLRFCPHSVLSLTPPLHIRHPTLPLPSLSTLIERSFSPAPRTQLPTSISPLRRVRTASA
ncbi:unknown [Clostridium sp. CAG:413]|nr:unknown [Clostridium sp. CAG:413]